MVVISWGIYLALPPILLLGGSIYHLSEAVDDLHIDSKSQVSTRILCAASYLTAAVAWVGLMLYAVVDALRV